MITNSLISITGAVAAVVISLVGARHNFRYNILLQNRKLKEDHYVAYLEALHNLSTQNINREFGEKFVMARSKLLIIADENVIKEMLSYEHNVFGKEDLNQVHDIYLTALITAIRHDLKLVDKDFPKINFKKL